MKYGKSGILQKVKFLKTDNFVMSRREGIEIALS